MNTPGRGGGLFVGLQYGAAMAASALALLARLAFDPYLENRLPHFTFLIAVAGVAWIGRTGPALLCTALGFLGARWFFTAPRGSLGIETVSDAVAAAGYFMVTLAIVGISHAMHRARQALLARQAELEREISERQSAEETTRFQSSLVDAVADAIISTDADFVIRSWNKAAEDIYGWQAAEVTGRSSSEVLRGRYPNQSSQDVARQFVEQGRWAGEAVHKRKNGTDVFVMASVTRLVDRSGRPVGAVAVNRDVTAYKAVEQVLRSKEVELSEAQRLAHVGSWTWDMKTDGVTGSDELLRIFGLDPATTSGPEFREQTHRFFAPEILQSLDAARQEALRTGVWPQMDVEALREGVPIWVTMGGTAVRDADGRIVGLRGAVQDITGWKRAEEQLRELSQRLTYHVDNSPLAVIEWGPDMRLTRWSGEAERMFGWKAEEVLGKRLEDFRWIHAEDETRVANVSAGLRSGTTPSRFSANRNYRKDGSVVHCEWYNSSLVDAGGRLRSILSLVLDVTERRRAEAALRESEWRLNRAQEIAHLGSWELDVEHDSLSWSSEVYRIFGLRPQEFGATYEAFLDAVHPDDRAAVDAAYSESLRSGRDAYEIEHRIVRRPLGEVRIVFERCEHVRDGSGRIVRSVGMVQDITERKRTEEVLQRSEAALQRANDDLRTVNTRLQVAGEELAAANEELRAMNESLEARVSARTADLERRTTRLRALAAELTRAEERERRRVARLIHDHLQQLLAVARINVELLRRKCAAEGLEDDLMNVDGLIAESLSAARSLTAELSPSVLYRSGLVAALKWLARWYEEQHALAVDVMAAQDADVESEELRIALFGSVRELLFNVVKHARVPSAQVSLSREDGAVQIVVRDSGLGFDPADVRDREGTAGSYGLFSLRERLESLGCSVEVESAPGAGTRVTILAQVPQASAPVRPADQRSQVPSRAYGEEHPISILLVDDHPVVRDGLARAFQDEAGLEVVGQARDGQEAIDLTRALRPDVVLMDIGLPVIDGIEATRLITAEMPQVRIIGLSAFEDESHRAAMCQAGAVDCIDKTANVTDVVAAVRRHGSVARRPAFAAGPGAAD